MSKEEDEKKYKELEKISNEITEEKMKELMKTLSPLDLYNRIHEEAFIEGFDCGMDVELDELHEAARSLGDLYLHALHDMVEKAEIDNAVLDNALLEKEEDPEVGN